jgi:hypothetical protein
MSESPTSLQESCRVHLRFQCGRDRSALVTEFARAASPMCSALLAAKSQLVSARILVQLRVAIGDEWPQFWQNGTVSTERTSTNQHLSCPDEHELTTIPSRLRLRRIRAHALNRTPRTRAQGTPSILIYACDNWVCGDDQFDVRGRSVRSAYCQNQIAARMSWTSVPSIRLLWTSGLVPHGLPASRMVMIRAPRGPQTPKLALEAS